MPDFKAMRKWLESLNPDDLPDTPWSIGQGRYYAVYVSDNKKFLGGLIRDCYEGSPRARRGVLEADCKALARRLENG